jgi:hypothetical protein
MFGMFSRRKPEAKTAPEDECVSLSRIDRALRREREDGPLPQPVGSDAAPVISAAKPPPDMAADAGEQDTHPEAPSGSEEPGRGPPQGAGHDPLYEPVIEVPPSVPAGSRSETGPKTSDARVAAADAELETDDADVVLLSVLGNGFRTSWSGARSAYATGGSGTTAAFARPAEAPVPLASTEVDRVLVPRLARDGFAREAGDYDLVRAVVTFVDTMLSEGLHTRAELPPRTLQLYHANRYLSGVNAGGHRRLVHAAGGSLARMLADARTAFAAIGATVALDALNRFTDWVSDNPDEAARPVPVHHAPVGLPEELDDMIQEAAMADTLARAAAWISGWDDLVVVDDATYPEKLRTLALSNPLREPRLLHRSIRHLHRQLVEPVLAATGMACAACPEPEMRLAVEGPVAVDVDGVPRAAYVLRTNEALQRLCLLDNPGAAIHEQAPTEPTDLEGLSEIEDMEQALATGLLPQDQIRRTGRRLAHVGRDLIDQAMALAGSRHAAAAIDLLLRRAELDPENAAAAPAVIELHPDGETVTFLVATQARALFVASTPKGAILVRPGDMQTLFTASAADIAAHAARSAEGAQRPRRETGRHR